MPSRPIHIQIDKRELDAVTDLFGGLTRDARRVISRAINKTLGTKSGGMRKIIADEIRKDVNVTKSFIYKQTGKKTEQTFRIRKATVRHPTGSISTTGANVPLIQYSNQRGNRKRRAKSISVQVQKSRGRKKLRHAFVPILHSGHRGIFVREFPGAKGKSGRKIKQLFGSRIPDVLSNPNVYDDVERRANDLFLKHIRHETDYLLSQKRSKN